MRNLRITSPFSIAIVATVVFGLSFIWGSPFSLTGSDGAQAAGSAADAFSIDTDPGLTPANTAIVLGSRETCLRISENDTLDVDEDSARLDLYPGIATSGSATTLTDNAVTWAIDAYAGMKVEITNGTGAGQKRTIVANTVDTLTVSASWATDPDTTSEYAVFADDVTTLDVTVSAIPTTNRMIGFSYTLSYPTDLSIIAEDPVFKLKAAPGSSVLDASEAVPDHNGSYGAAVADTGPIPGSAESGSGVLQRITVATVETAVGVGVFPLSIGSASHVDTTNTVRTPDAVQNAVVAINRGCPLPSVDIELVSLSLTSVAPFEPAVTDFDLTVQATANNNGPNPADIRFDLGIAAPGDCTLTPPGNQTEDFLNVLPTQSRTSTQVWTANCSTPSTHLFSGSGTVSVIGLAEETTPANNGPLTDPETIGITGDADVKVLTVAVDAPPDAATGQPFPVNVAVTLHNNGDLDPVNVDTTVDLQMPPGCTRAPDNDQVVNDTSLGVSAAVLVQASWTVSCTTTGLKTFTGTASAVIDQLHTTDPNPNNNSGQGQDTTDTSLGVADVKVTSETVTSPPSAAVNTNFPVTVATTVHNNGPFFPVNTDITLTLNLPADCFTPVTTIVFQDGSLGPSIAAQLPDITFYVACINHSFHNITATATVAIDDPLAGDPNPGNNTQTSAASTTAIIRTADFKVSGVTLGAPASGNTAVPFNVTVDATVHNNGPDSGPVDAVVTLTMPTDCTTPVNPETVSMTLEPSLATPMPTQTFAVTCTTESFHDFEATVTLVPPLHVVDPDLGSNSATGGPVTVSVIGLSDLELAAATASGPPSASLGVPFNISSTATVHNNGPFGPTNGAVTVTLSLPLDCTTPDPNPQVFTNVNLPVSTNVSSIATWSVTCTNKSSHSFTANASVAVNQNHVDDPTPGNNAATSSAAVVAVIATTDGKIMSATVLSPPTFIAANVNVPITVRTVFHNNGPFGPANFNLTRSVTPPPGCTVVPPAMSSHLLAVSTPVTIDAIWTINCTPGSYNLNFANSLTVTDLHVSDPVTGNNTSAAFLSVSVDTDGDGLADDIETACGSNPNNGSSLPERIDGVHAGVDDDLDSAIDEVLPPSAANYDCDRDGYTGGTENHVYSPSIRGDQDPCGANLSPPTTPPTPIGWPADLIGGGVPDSTNLVTLLDITSFLAPVRYLGSYTGTNPSDYRWDLVPGPSIVNPEDINLTDLTNLLVVSPPMLGGVRALNGPSCPSP